MRRGVRRRPITMGRRKTIRGKTSPNNIAGVLLTRARRPFAAASCLGKSAVLYHTLSGVYKGYATETGFSPYLTFKFTTAPRYRCRSSLTPILRRPSNSTSPAGWRARDSLPHGEISRGPYLTARRSRPPDSVTFRPNRASHSPDFVHIGRTPS